MRFDWGSVHEQIIHFLNGFAAYDLADWLKLLAAVVGGLVTTYGWWKAYRYSKYEIAKRLLEYLAEHEKGIIESRKALLRQFQFGDTFDAIIVHDSVRRASHLAKKARYDDGVQALNDLKQSLNESAGVGEFHRDVAHYEAATVLLFMGIMAMRANQAIQARQYLDEALDLSKTDADVMKWMGDLEFKLGHLDDALVRYSSALENAGKDHELKANVWRQRAEIYERLGRPGLERRDLANSASIYAQINRWKEAATAYVRLAEVLEQGGATQRARAAFQDALEMLHAVGGWPQRRDHSPTARYRAATVMVAAAARSGSAGLAQTHGRGSDRAQRLFYASQPYMSADRA